MKRIVSLFIEFFRYIRDFIDALIEQASGSKSRYHPVQRVIAGFLLVLALFYLLTGIRGALAIPLLILVLAFVIARNRRALPANLLNLNGPPATGAGKSNRIAYSQPPKKHP